MELSYPYHLIGCNINLNQKNKYMKTKMKYLFVAAFVLLSVSCSERVSKKNVKHKNENVRSDASLESKKKDEAGTNKIEPVYDDSDVELTFQMAEEISYEEDEEDLLSERTVRSDVPKEDLNTEEYDHIVENEFKSVVQNPLSTLSIDVDNASYSNVRRYIEMNSLPPKNAVRIEEMINYFTYDYPDPKGKHPFEFITEYSKCPWNKDNMLLHVGIQGKKLDYQDLKPSNLVLLLDVSGSMSDQNKLPLLKKGLNLLLDELDNRDKVSIVVYASATGLVLPPTPASERDKIKEALGKLSAGGVTAGGEGIKLAYKTAEESFIKGGNNRIILATDGDFNLGISSTGALVDLIEEERQKGIYLTILGLGMGNYKDGRMEQISNAGNGNYFYIDNIREAEKVFVKELRANMFTIAKDVKIQIEFNPAAAKAYRLIGYENRLMASEDFDNDAKDAGELGAGHTVTALYEIIPAGSATEVHKASDLKYSDYNISDKGKKSGDLMTIKFRYKPIGKNKSVLIESPVPNVALKSEQTSNNFNFSAAVAAFGMKLRDSKFKGKTDYELIESLGKKGKGADKNGYRNEFLKLVHTAKLLSR